MFLDSEDAADSVLYILGEELNEKGIAIEKNNLKLQGGVDNELELKGSEFRAFNFELYVIEELEELIEEGLTIYEGRYSDKEKNGGEKLI